MAPTYYYVEEIHNKEIRNYRIQLSIISCTINYRDVSSVRRRPCFKRVRERLQKRFNSSVADKTRLITGNKAVTENRFRIKLIIRWKSMGTMGENNNGRIMEEDKSLIIIDSG